MATKKKSSHRLSSLFSLSSLSLSSSQDHKDDTRSASASDRLSPVPGYSPNASPGIGKLTKSPHERAGSGQLLTPPVYSSPVPYHSELPSTSPQIGWLEDLPPPPTIGDVSPGSRSMSPSTSRPGSRASSRPATPTLEVTIEGPAQTKHSKLRRMSWMPGSSKSHNRDGSQAPTAWVVGHPGKIPYNLGPLLAGEKVPELWDEGGDTYVYLFPPNSGKGPSFRVDSAIYAASPPLTRLAFGRLYSDAAVASGDRRSQQLETASSDSLTESTQLASDIGSSDGSKGSRALSDPSDAASEVNLYLPLRLSSLSNGPITDNNQTAEDLDILVGIRNFFAFLVGQSLVATPSRSSVFSIFIRIADILRDYEFSNLDGSTFGEVAAASFDNYVEELGLADVRSSREKTIETIVLGERMRSAMLYNEAFGHGVGKFDDLRGLGSPKFDLISPVTLNRMERAAMDLYLRQKNIDLKLQDFEFPAIFAGIMSSKTAEERKTIRFDAWKAAFVKMRTHVLSYYKHKYGSWPPKASSKKNTLETSGLNRLVLRDLYHDFSNLYDLLVDRGSLTTRTTEGPSIDDDADDEAAPARALRRVLSEYDRSTPPVQPPVPFDIPLLPSLKTTRKDYLTGDAKKDAKARKKHLKDSEIATILSASYNLDANISTPFLDSFRDFERKSAHGKNIDDLCDHRNGQWIFMYAILQSLPMLVVDAPGVRWAHGVEYFLCEPPRSGVPWARELTGVQRSWYGVAGSTQVVSLPSDIIEHGVEGVYRRSHCWQMAEKWTAHSGLMQAAVMESVQPPLPPPGLPGVLMPGSRPGTPTIDNRRRESVMNLGLEALPLPAGVAPDSPVVRPVSSHDPSKTFDAILGGVEGKKKKKK